MSHVTNLILTYPLAFGMADVDEPDHRLQEVNLFFDEQRGFARVREAAGGDKYLETVVLVGAFNGLDLKGLVAHLRALSWKQGRVREWDYSRRVQLFVQEQDDDGFSMIYVCDPPEPVKDEACDACTHDLETIVFGRAPRVTLCAGHLATLLGSRNRS